MMNSRAFVEKLRKMKALSIFLLIHLKKVKLKAVIVKKKVLKSTLSVYMKQTNFEKVKIQIGQKLLKKEVDFFSFEKKD